MLGWLGGFLRSFTDLDALTGMVPSQSATVRFKPAPAVSTPFAVDDLIKRYQQAAAAGGHHPVLLPGLFTLDLLVIHPFEDGNGRVARLLTGACSVTTATQSAAT